MRTPTIKASRSAGTSKKATKVSGENLRYASWWQRAYALLVDSAVGLGLLVPIVASYHWMTSSMVLRPRPILDANGQMQASLTDPSRPALQMAGTHPASLAAQYALMAFVVIAVAFAVVNTVLLPANTGYSLGKWVAGLRLVSTDRASAKYGKPIGVARTLLRSLLAVLDGIAFFWRAWRKERASLADTFCKAAVVVARPDAPTDLWLTASVRRRRLNRAGLVLATAVVLTAPVAYVIHEAVQGILVSPPAISVLGWQHNAQMITTSDGKVSIRVPADWYLANELTVANTNGIGYGLAVQSMNPFESTAPEASITAVVYSGGKAAVQMAADIEAAKKAKSCRYINELKPRGAKTIGINGPLWVCDRNLEYINETPAGSMLVTVDMTGNTYPTAMAPILESIKAQ